MDYVFSDYYLVATAQGRSAQLELIRMEVEKFLEERRRLWRVLRAYDVVNTMLRFRISPFYEVEVPDEIFVIILASPVCVYDAWQARAFVTGKSITIPLHAMASAACTCLNGTGEDYERLLATLFPAFLPFSTN